MGNHNRPVTEMYANSSTREFKIETSCLLKQKKLDQKEVTKTTENSSRIKTEILSDSKKIWQVKLNSTHHLTLISMYSLSLRISSCSLLNANILLSLQGMKEEYQLLVSELLVYKINLKSLSQRYICLWQTCLYISLITYLFMSTFLLLSEDNLFVDVVSVKIKFWIQKIF